MNRVLPLQSRRLLVALVASAALAAAAGSALAAKNGPESRDTGTSASIPTAEPELTAGPNATLEAAEPPVPASVTRSDHRTLESVLGLFVASGPRGGAHLSAERTARATEHRGSLAAETRPGRATSRRTPARQGGSADYVGRPHRMPSPEIL